MFKKRPDRNDKTRRLSSKKLEELVLPRAKLRFCPEQLQNLNYIFQKKLRLKAASGMDKSLLLARSVTERLVQRLVSCVGMLDPRFSTKFLISSQSQANMGLPSRDLEYLVRLDCLSTPSIYQSDPPPRYSVMENDPDYPAAYARLRLQTNTLKMWGDCANSAGYLRRDRVQAKFVELLLQAANSDFPNSPLNVDESVHCGTPGKVVDACTLHEILKVPTEQHVFYGPGGNMPRFPDPRDFRRAIVDEPDGIRLRVEFLSPALSTFSINVRILIAIGVDAWPASTNFPSRITLGHTDCLLYNQAAQTTVSEQVLESYSRIFSINVRILIAIGVDAWPASTNFPSRITLGHTDCLLYNQAAQTGMYLVGYGVQSSAWQIRVPAAQETVLRHYGPNSTIRTILDVLVDTLEEIDSNRNVKKHQVSYRILNKYAFLTLLLRSLEESSFSPSSDLISWSPMYLSTHVLEILDQAIVALCNQSLPNYFFTKSNLMVNPGHLCEDDYFAEANNVKSYVLRLFDEALMSTMGVEEFSRIITWQESETVLLHKWKDLIDGLVPPSGGGGRTVLLLWGQERFGFWARSVHC